MTIHEVPVTMPVVKDPAVKPTEPAARAQSRSSGSPEPSPGGGDEDESGAYADLDRTGFTPLTEVTVGPGATAQVSLPVKAGSAVLGSARWSGTTARLSARLEIDGTEVASGEGGGRDGSGTIALTARAGVDGTSRLVMTNPAATSVDALLVLGTLEKDQ